MYIWIHIHHPYSKHAWFLCDDLGQTRAMWKVMYTRSVSNCKCGSPSAFPETHHGKRSSERSNSWVRESTPPCLRKAVASQSTRRATATTVSVFFVLSSRPALLVRGGCRSPTLCTDGSINVAIFCPRTKCARWYYLCFVLHTSYFVLFAYCIYGVLVNILVL